MRTPAGWGIYAAVDPVARIVIDFAGLAAPIEGSLRRDDGKVVEFAGYMQLITAIESALQSARERIGAGRLSVVVEPLPPLDRHERE